MNRQQLYTFSGVLLASTALSGMASAGTIGVENAGGLTVGFGTTAQKIASTAFSTTATTADAVTFGPGAPFAALFTNRFANTVKFSVSLNLTGAQFVTSSVTGANTKVLVVGTAGITAGSTISSATACVSVTPLVTQLIVDGCQITQSTAVGLFTLTAAGLIFSGVTFNTGNSLATSGSSLALSGNVYNFNNAQQTFENITSGNIVTSSSSTITATVTAGSSVTANPLATPVAFASLSNTQATPAAVSVLSLNLARVTISGAGVLSTDLSAPITVNTAATSVTVTTASTLLSGGAVATFVATAGTATLLQTSTVANFSAGAQTFQVTAAAGNYSSFTINVVFSGTASIPAAVAGTVTVAYGSTGTNSIQAPAATTGSTAAVSRGGFNAEVNTFNSSGNTGFQSFVRIHNNGTVAGTATVTVKNDTSSSGATLGAAFTTGTIQPGGTLQLAASDLEGTLGANIPAASRTGFYTVQVTGPIVGYVQHILFNPTSGQVSDVSAFRNHGDTANNP